MKIKPIVILFLLCIQLQFLAGQQMPKLGSTLSKEEMMKISLSSKQKQKILDALVEQIRGNYILENKRESTVSELIKRSKTKEFKQSNDAYSYLTTLTSSLREITNDAHFNIWYNPQMYEMMEQFSNGANGQGRVMRGAPSGNQGARSRRGGSGPQMRRGPMGWPDGRENNYFFKNLEILDGNVGYLKLEKIPVLDNAKSTVDASMAFLANTDAVIVDLRNNPGGFEGFISYFMSYFYPDGEKKLLFTRENIMRGGASEYYTEESLPGSRLNKVPLYVLINENTGSAATNMTYNLQKHDRAIVVGRTTEKGIMGAHSAMPMPLADNFMATIPIGTITHSKTKTNWNFTGVVPDIETEEDAKQVAHEAALKTLKK